MITAFLFIISYSSEIGNIKRAAICRPLCHRIQHIFNKDAVAHGGIVHQHVGHSTDEFAVLDNGTAGHADVK